MGNTYNSKQLAVTKNAINSTIQNTENYYQEQQLPNSILNDFQKAAEETEYEISANTRRNYQASFSIFNQYCQQHNLKSVPADPRVIISFIGHQKELFQKNGVQLSKQTLTTRLAAIRFFHIQAGVRSPTDHPLVLRVMRGLSRNHTRIINDYEQLPIMYDELELLLQAIAKESELTRLRDTAILCLGLQGGFRRSEIAGIQTNHVSFLKDKIKVRLPFSKSNQSGNREWKDLPNSEYFAAGPAIKEWLTISGIKDGHLFRSISRNGKKLRPYQVKDKDSNNKNSGFLNGDDIYRIIKKYCAKSGLSAEFFGAHSLRSGCVTQLHENNKDSLYIMARTGHTDPRSLRHYLKPKD